MECAIRVNIMLVSLKLVVSFGSDAQRNVLDRSIFFAHYSGCTNESTIALFTVWKRLHCLFTHSETSFLEKDIGDV